MKSTDKKTGSKKALTAAGRMALAEKKKDDAVIALIKGLDLLMAYACVSELFCAERMMHAAKEKIVHWAAEKDFFESDKERFVNRHLSNSVLTVYDILPKYLATSDANIQNQLMRSLLVGQRTAAAHS